MEELLRLCRHYDTHCMLRATNSEGKLPCFRQMRRETNAFMRTSYCVKRVCWLFIPNKKEEKERKESTE